MGHVYEIGRRIGPPRDGSSVGPTLHGANTNGQRVAGSFSDTVTNKTVPFRPFPGHVFSITGSEACAGCVGELERSGGYYQRDLAALLQRRLPPDAVVADVGAYIGVVTVLLAGLCPKGHVYAFEPGAENYLHLTGNIAANGFDNVTAQRTAVFDQDGEIDFEFEPGYPGGSHVGSAGTAVRSLRLDTWAREERLERLDLVKVDVEGVELPVLDGAEETLRRFRPILVVECNPVALPRFGGTDYATLLRRMRDLFSVVGVIGPEGSVTPVVSAAHLSLILGRRGVVDLIGLPTAGVKELARERARSVVSLARLLLRHNRWRRPEQTFVVDPGDISLQPAVRAVTGAPATVLEVPVEVRNSTRSWLSSAFPHHPVHVSYRWLDQTGERVVPEGRRTVLPEPLAPGRSVRVAVAVDTPVAPGHYTLMLTLVQEGFAWLDDADPRCTARVPAVVGEPA
jgi:FkbM family methyltransferase